MKRIYKYAIEPVFSIPRGARILYVALQEGKPKVWAEVDPEQHATDDYGAFPTGALIEPGFVHCGSWQTQPWSWQAPPFVWHLYRLGPSP